MRSAEKAGNRCRTCELFANGEMPDGWGSQEKAELFWPYLPSGLVNGRIPDHEWRYVPDPHIPKTPGWRKALGLGLHAAFLVLVACILLAGAGQAETAATQRVQLGGYELEVPRRYLKGDEIPAWLRLLPGLDKDPPGIRLKIAAAEVAAAVPGFEPAVGRYVDDLHLRLFALREFERLRYLDPQWLADAWNGTGSYHDRIIETDPKTRFIRIYRRIEHPFRGRCSPSRRIARCHPIGFRSGSRGVWTEKVR